MTCIRFSWFGVLKLEQTWTSRNNSLETRTDQQRGTNVAQRTEGRSVRYSSAGAAQKDCQAEFIAWVWAHTEVSKGQALLAQGDRKGASAALKRAQVWVKRALKERP